MTKGQKIKRKREELNISQTDLAKRVGISKQTLYKYENDIVTNIPSDKLEKIADALSVPPSYLMGWGDESIDPYYSSPDYYISITDEEKYLIETFRDMSAKTKEAFIEYGEYLSQRDIQKG